LLKASLSRRPLTRRLRGTREVRDLKTGADCLEPGTFQASDLVTRPQESLAAAAEISALAR
jgi:hypothetical protein